MALASKSPVSVLLLLGLAIGSTLLRRERPITFGEVSVLLALVSLAAGLSLRFDLNMGLRYILPVYPLAAILVARLWTLGPKIRAASWILLAMLVVESLWICPRYLTFFNLLVGGPGHGWKVVNDSSFD